MFSSVNPFVRYAAKSTYFIDAKVRARDCHLLYILSGRGDFEFDRGQSFPLASGALVYYPPGLSYHISSKDGMLFYTVNFDFTRAYAEGQTGILCPSAEKNSDLPLLNADVPQYFESPIFIAHAEFAEPLLKEIYSEAARPRAFAADASSAALKLLLIGIYRSGEGASDERTLFSRIKE